MYQETSTWPVYSRIIINRTVNKKNCCYLLSVGHAFPAAHILTHWHLPAAPGSRWDPNPFLQVKTLSAGRLATRSRPSREEIVGIDFNRLSSITAHGSKPAIFNRRAARILKTCKTWLFIQGHWPFPLKTVKIKTDNSQQNNSAPCKWIKIIPIF